MQRLDYEPYGKELVSEGTGARTSFIGRERDGESDLGFFGVRLYDSDYGRFLSTDKMWEKYRGIQSYHYASLSPVTRLDDNGLWDINVAFVQTDPTKDEPRLGVATVVDNDGNEVFSFPVRGDGKAGDNRMVENSDTPTGEYSINGWINPTSYERQNFGKNARLSLS